MVGVEDETGTMKSEAIEVNPAWCLGAQSSPGSFVLSIPRDSILFSPDKYNERTLTHLYLAPLIPCDTESFAV